MTINSSPVLQINLPITLTVGDYLEGQISSAIAAQYGDKITWLSLEPFCKVVENAFSAKGYSVEMITVFLSSQRPEIDEHSCVHTYLNTQRHEVFAYRALIDIQTENHYLQREPIQLELSFQCLGKDDFFEKSWSETYIDCVENLAERCFLFFRYGVRKYCSDVKRCFSSN